MTKSVVGSHTLILFGREAGPGTELTEYSIGVNALGYPAEYTPDVDLPPKPRCGVLLELPKGSYRLRLTRLEAALETVVQMQAVEPLPVSQSRLPFLMGVL